jgi:hypothetical protein
MVTKILTQRSTDFGVWRQRVNIIAGVGGFNPSSIRSSGGDQSTL